MLHEKFQNNYEFKMRMFDEVIRNLKLNPVADKPTLRIYFNIVLLSREKDEKYFFELKNLKDRFFDELNAADKYMLFLHMANY